MAYRGNIRDRNRDFAEFDPIGRKHDMQLNQRNDMEEMSWQIAKLRVQVLQMQASTMGKVSKNARVPIEDSFDAPHWCRANFDRLELPKFDGSPNTFNEWLDTLERVFVRHDVSDERKVKLVSKCLKGRIYDWWDDLQVTRQRKGKGKIRDWDDMKKKFKEKYFPWISTPTLLVTKQQSGIVSSPKQQVSNCRGSGKLLPAVTPQKHMYEAGSRPGQPFHKYSQACSLPSFGTNKTFVSGQQSRAENGMFSAPNQLADGMWKAANQSHSSAFNGFKCGDPSSKPLDWRKARENRTLLSEELLSEEPVSNHVSNHATYEDIGEDFVKQWLDTSCEGNKSCDQGDESYYPSFVHYEDDGIFEEHESVTVEGEMEQSCMYDDVPIFDHYGDEDDLVDHYDDEVNFVANGDYMRNASLNVETKPSIVSFHAFEEVLAENHEPDHALDLIPKVDTVEFVSFPAAEDALDLIPKVDTVELVTFPAAEDLTRKYAAICFQEVLPKLVPKQDTQHVVEVMSTTVYSFNLGWQMLPKEGKELRGQIGDPWAYCRHAKWTVNSHLNMAAVDVHKWKLILKVGCLS